MKLYPQAFNLFAEQSGTLRTPASRQSFRYVCSNLQSQHPAKHAHQFMLEDLTEFCLGKGLAPKTIQHRRTVVRSVFAWLAWKEIVKTDPAAGLKYTVSPGRHSVRMGNWLDRHQAGELIRSCPPDPVGRRDRLVLLFGLMLGLRRAEIANLRWSDFSSDLSRLQLKGKGQKLAVLGVPKQLRAELEDWRREAPADAVAVLPRVRRLGFPELHDEIDWHAPLGITGVARVVQRAGERCSIPNLAPHDLRRTYANILETDGTNLPDIQRAMRHSNVGTTGGYLDKNPRRAIAVTEGMTLEY